MFSKVRQDWTTVFPFLHLDYVDIQEEKKILRLYVTKMICNKIAEDEMEVN